MSTPAAPGDGCIRAWTLPGKVFVIGSWQDAQDAAPTNLAPLMIGAAATTVRVPVHEMMR